MRGIRASLCMELLPSAQLSCAMHIASTCRAAAFLKYQPCPLQSTTNSSTPFASKPQSLCIELCFWKSTSNPVQISINCHFSLVTFRWLILLIAISEKSYEWLHYSPSEESFSAASILETFWKGILGPHVQNVHMHKKMFVCPFWRSCTDVQKCTRQSRTN